MLYDEPWSKYGSAFKNLPLKTPNNEKIFNDLWHRMLYLQNGHTANTNNINSWILLRKLTIY